MRRSIVAMGFRADCSGGCRSSRRNGNAMGFPLYRLRVQPEPVSIKKSGFGPGRFPIGPPILAATVSSPAERHGVYASVSSLVGFFFVDSFWLLLFEFPLASVFELSLPKDVAKRSIISWKFRIENRWM